MQKSPMRGADPLLQPYRLKNLTLKNRIMSSAHEPNYADDGMPTERYRLYHVEKARGGIALTMTAGSAIVSPDSAPAFGNLFAYKDEIVPHLKLLAEGCQELGCAVMIQLTHLGRRTNWNKADWLPVLAASRVREPAHRSFPKIMEDWDMARILKDYVAAAERMKAAGLDGIEIQCYGHLLDGFWSPWTNRREDGYGGALENRLRFSQEVFGAIRKAVGPDFIVGARLVCDEDWERGISREEGLEIVRRLIAGGSVDFLNVIRGRIEHDALLEKMIPVHGSPSAPLLDFAGEIREATKFPVFHAAKIADVATARHAIAEGKLDMVGMTRAHIADPHIVAKIVAGREEEIRPCVGATYCLDRIYMGHEALCIHNAATGREQTMPHALPKAGGARKKVLVVGAGPAGLEAARVSAERGHRVLVMEASARAGGQIGLIARQRRRADFSGIVDWRLAMLEKLGVEIRYNLLAEAADVRAENPDIVVVATGGFPALPELDGGAELAVSTWDILSGDVKPGEKVLLFDDNGDHPGLQAADLISESGSALEFVTPETSIAPEMGGLNLVPYIRNFQARGVRMTLATRVRALARDGNRIKVTLWSQFTEQDLEERLVDQVVMEHGTLPSDELYFDLKEESSNRGEVDYQALMAGRPQNLDSNPEGAFKLFRIGDAVASRNIHAAIYDALRLAKDF